MSNIAKEQIRLVVVFFQTEKHAGEHKVVLQRPVSYTHLDVYKRQRLTADAERYLEQFERFAHDLERFVNDAFAANFHLPD